MKSTYLFLELVECETYLVFMIKMKCGPIIGRMKMTNCDSYCGTKGVKYKHALACIYVHYSSNNIKSS